MYLKIFSFVFFIFLYGQSCSMFPAVQCMQDCVNNIRLANFDKARSCFIDAFNGECIHPFCYEWSCLEYLLSRTNILTEPIEETDDDVLSEKSVGLIINIKPEYLHKVFILYHALTTNTNSNLLAFDFNNADRFFQAISASTKKFVDLTEEYIKETVAALLPATNVRKKRKHHS